MLALLLALTFSSPALAQTPTTWDLSHIYADDATWETARAELEAQADALHTYKGQLHKGGNLVAALEVYFAQDKSLSRLWSYASQRADGDLNDPGPQGMKQRLSTMYSEMSAAQAWFEPEILSISAGKLAKLCKGTSCDPYRRYLARLDARRSHVLDADIERVLGMSSRLKGVGGSISGTLRNAEIPWPTVTLSDGSDLKLTPSGYVQGRSSMDRDDRITVFKGFFGQLDAFETSFAQSLGATVQEHIFNARVRNYDSSLDASLSGSEVDPMVYDMLLEEMGKGLPTLHRYLRLRGRMMGVSDLRYHDMYPPLVADVAESYTYERSLELTLDALGILGDDYVERLAMAFDKGWVDVYPKEGKRSGAYVTDGAYDVHPYMLLNHTDDYTGLTTLAHEAGHLMHSSFSQEAQPYPTAGYATFVAEVASTVNEVLLFEHLLAKAETKDAKLALLGHFLEGLRTTVFRQTMLGEFERDVHARAEAGEPIDAATLDGMYGDLLRRYHGEAEGVMVIDDLYTSEWSYIPHFHYNFYVYQYATSYIAGIALTRPILEGDKDATARYRAFLASGSTKPPVELLKDAGVDMTSPQPMRDALAYMDSVIDRIEALLDEE